MRRMIALVVLLGLVPAGCSRAVRPIGATVAPAGFSLPQGSTYDVGPGAVLPVSVHVGDLVKLDFDDDEDDDGGAQDATDWPVLRLAEVRGRSAIYQAVAPGVAFLIIGPHGYPCPPSARHCDTDGPGPLKIRVIVDQPG